MCCTGRARWKFPCTGTPIRIGTFSLGLQQKPDGQAYCQNRRKQTSNRARHSSSKFFGFAAGLSVAGGNQQRRQSLSSLRQLPVRFLDLLKARRISAVVGVMLDRLTTIGFTNGSMVRVLVDTQDLVWIHFGTYSCTPEFAATV